MEFYRSSKYEQIAGELIASEGCLSLLKVDNLKVVCLVSDKVKVDENKRRVYADTEKVPPKFQWATDADVIITIYQPNVATFTPEKQRIVILRELLKVSIDTGDDDSKRRILLNDYDLKDFRLIISRYGPNWDEDKGLFEGVEDV